MSLAKASLDPASGGGDWGMVEETKTKKEESKKDGGWGNIADMKA